MPDMIQPVATAIKPYDAGAGLSNLSSMLGIQQQRQALQTGQYLQQSAQAGAITTQQGAKELQAGSQLLADPVGNGLVDEEGNPTKNAYSIIKSVMPTTGDERYQSLLKTAQGHVEFRNSVQNLSQNEQGYVSSRLAGIAADPDAHISDVTNGISALEAQFKGTAEEESVHRMVKVMKDAVDDAGDKHGMDGVRKVVNGFSRGAIGNAALTGAGGVATPTPGTVTTGTQTVTGATQPITGKFVPSGQSFDVPASVAASPGGPLSVVNPGKGTVKPLESTATAPPPPPPNKLQPLQRPGINAPRADQEAYQAQIAKATQDVSTARDAAVDPMNGVQATRFRNQQILDLIPHASTGPGMRLLNTLASRLPGASGDAYQDLEHYTAQNSAALAQKMGVPKTNLGAETAGAAAGNVERNPGALREITKTNDALNTAFDLYNRGLQKTTGNGNDLSKVNAYKQAFGSALDVNAVRWADAHRRKDQEEIDQLTQKLGPKGIAQAQQRLRVLKSLSETGDLP